MKVLPKEPFAEPNQFLAARSEFGQVFGDLAKGKRNWQLVAFASLTLLAVVTLAYIRMASEARITPYVVEVDQLGQARAFGPAEQIRKTDQRVIASQLGMFIRNLRTVFADPAAQRELAQRAYAFVDENAAGFLNTYFSDPANNPVNLSRQFTRLVEVQSVLPVPDSKTWKVVWRETELPLLHGSSRTTAWEAYLSADVMPPRTTDTIEVNPLGLYVTAISWTQVTQGSTPTPQPEGITP
ncbi:MAG: conjugal transfer protein TrbF [Gemmatimonadetes bacterium]|nr:conjugal transfer protein TrbF [Gemmatimonadota bacterium]